MLIAPRKRRQESTGAAYPVYQTKRGVFSKQLMKRLIRDRSHVRTGS